MKSISKISQPETESHHISNLMLPLGKKEGSWKAQSHNFAMTMTDLVSFVPEENSSMGSGLQSKKLIGVYLKVDTHQIPAPPP